MGFSGGYFTGHELHAHGLGPLSEVVQHALAVPFFEVILPPVGVFLPVGEHGVDQAASLCAAAVTALGLSMRAHIRR